MASTILLIIILLSFGFCIPRYGVFSVIGIGIIGLTVYSIPALIGFYTTPISAGRYFIPASRDAIMQMALAWFILLLWFLIASKFALLARTRIKYSHDNRYNYIFKSVFNVYFLMGMLLFSLVCLIYTVHTYGLLFFLAQKDSSAINTDPVATFWRWSNIIGLLFAISLKYKKYAIYFLIANISYFISGDRTVIVILIFSILVFFFSGKNIFSFIKSPLGISSIILSGIIVVLGKPFYLSVKEGDWGILVDYLSSTNNVELFSGFEPFLIHGHLETVMGAGFRYPIGDLLSGVLGQFLLVPSAFGIDSQRFNIAFTQAYYSSVNYGLAFNYWAEGYAIGKSIGVAVFALIYGFLLSLFDWVSRSRRLSTRVLGVVCGTVVAVYIHRNSLENVMVFLRQVFMVYLPVVAISVFLLNVSAPAARIPTRRVR